VAAFRAHRPLVRCREAERRAGIAASLTELQGRLELSGPHGPFLLTATADRIDRLHDGRLAIIDYKTGQLPKASAIELGFAPQLPLEAAIAAAGGFPDIPPAPVAELAHWRLSGGSPPGEINAVKSDAEAIAAEARAGLERLIAAFDDPETAYESRPRPDYAPRFSDYDHLARVREWSALGDE
jgi:ATP-dependent helicase/nuclease subunit B